MDETQKREFLKRMGLSGYPCREEEKPRASKKKEEDGKKKKDNYVDKAELLSLGKIFQVVPAGRASFPEPPMDIETPEKDL